MRHLLHRLPVRVVRIDWPFPALELVRQDGTGWLLCPLPTRKDRT